MDPLETFIVESTVEPEAEHYKQIIEDVISELVLARAIGRIKIVVRPEDSLFQMAIILRGGLPLVKVRDFADVGVEKGEVSLAIKSEEYMTQLLEILWANYGSSNVSQPERRTVLIRCEDPYDEVSTLENMVVADPQKTLQSRLIDMAVRATPEGFRVRYHSLEGDHFIFVATEDAMKQEWIDEAHSMFRELSGGE